MNNINSQSFAARMAAARAAKKGTASHSMQAPASTGGAKAHPAMPFGRTATMAMATFSKQTHGTKSKKGK